MNERAETSTPTDSVGDPPKVAVVLTGGGARGAYQVGVLRGMGKLFP